jgi:hypothetical protein
MTPRQASTTQTPQPGPGGAGGAGDWAGWKEAWQIRRAHPRWVIQWNAPAGLYLAYRLSLKHRDAILAAATPGDLIAQIEHAERAERPSQSARSRHQPATTPARDLR